MRRCVYGLFAGVFLIISSGMVHGSGTPGTLKWSYTTGGPIISSPAIGADGTIYVGSEDYRLYAVNPNGTLKWAYAVGGPITSSPAIGADGTIYVVSDDGNLYAFTTNGWPKWSYDTGNTTSGTAVTSSPAIGADGTIYVGSLDSNLYAVNPNGTLKWAYATGDGIISSPAIGADGAIYVGSGVAGTDTRLYAINSLGSLRWSFATGNSITSSPSIGADGTIYVGSQGFNLWAVNSDGSLKWSYVTGGPVTSSPSIGADQTIYVESDSLYAVSPNGSLKWSYAAGGIVSPAIGADGIIYVGSDNSSLYAVDPKGSLKWSYATGGPVTSSPVIGADKTIYVGSEDHKLYAIHSSSAGLASSPWPMFHHDLTHTGVFEPLPDLPTLVVAKSGTGTGTVTSNSSGIACGVACSASYGKGASVSLTAQPDTDCVFAGWSGDCTGTGTCKVSMKANRSVWAAFDKVTCSYPVSPRKKSFSYKEGYANVTVAAKGAKSCSSPYIAASDTWFSADLVSFKNNKGSVRITASANATAIARSGTVAIGGETFGVAQAGMPCAVTAFWPTSATPTSSPQSTSFAVTVPAGCAWNAEVSSGAPWLSVSSMTADRVNYWVTQNATGKQRNGKIKVYIAGNPSKNKTFTVTQQP